MKQLSVINRDNFDRCPRARVSAVVFNQDTGYIYGKGVNSACGGCSCDQDKTDTAVSASSTCEAVHAEIVALCQSPLSVTKGDGVNDLIAIATSRPPCKECYKALRHSSIRLIVTTGEWEDRDGTKEKWLALGRQWITV